MRRFSLLACAALTAALASGATRADVRYDLTAVSSYSFQGETISGSFSFIAHDFIDVDITVPVGALSSCEATATKGGVSRPTACLDQAIHPHEYDRLGYDTIGFNTGTLDFQRAVMYYFEDGAFGKYGNYETVAFGTDQFARLVVSQVPEPTARLSLLAGLALLCVARRGRRSSTDARGQAFKRTVQLPA